MTSTGKDGCIQHCLPMQKQWFHFWSEEAPKGTTNAILSLDFRVSIKCLAWWPGIIHEIYCNIVTLGRDLWSFIWAILLQCWKKRLFYFDGWLQAYGDMGYLLPHISSPFCWEHKKCALQEEQGQTTCNVPTGLE